MPCPYLKRCRKKVASDYYLLICLSGHRICFTYAELAEKEGKVIYRTPGEWSRKGG